MVRPPATLLVAIALLGAGCGDDGRTLRDPVFDPPEPPVETVTVTSDDPASVPTATPATARATPPSEPTTTAVDRTIEFDRLYSPANATAEVIGTGASPGDPVTVDGAPADVISFDATADGFVAQVRIDDEGAHTVCVADTCGRVFTLAADAEAPEEVAAKIDEALVLAADMIDPAIEFPDWSIEVGGPFSGTGGTTDVESKTITVHANRGRTVDDYVRTILHEFGHAADADRLDDAERAAYVAIRGVDPKRAWFDGESHRLDGWARQPGEDFAEMMVTIWSNGRWAPRTLVDRPPPTQAQLTEIAALVGIG